MKKTVRCLSLLLAAALLLTALTGCDTGHKGKIKTLIANFEKSCNTFDVQGLLDTIDPHISNKLSLGFGLIDLILNEDAEAEIRQAAVLIASELPDDSADFFRTMSITPQKHRDL